MILPEFSSLTISIVNQIVEELKLNKIEIRKSEDQNHTTEQSNYCVNCIRTPINEKQIPLVSNENDLLEKIKEGKGYIRCNVNILDYSPKEAENSILAYSQKNKTSMKIKNLPQNFDKSDIEYYLSLQFKVAFSHDSNSYFYVNLCNLEGEGNGFISVEADNYYLKPDLFTNMFQSLSKLNLNNNKADLCLKIEENNFLRIVGDYNNLAN